MSEAERLYAKSLAAVESSEQHVRDAREAVDKTWAMWLHHWHETEYREVYANACAAYYAAVALLQEGREHYSRALLLRLQEASVRHA